MRSSLRRILSLVLALTLLFSLAVTAFAKAPDRDGETPYSYYFLLGDSIPKKKVPPYIVEDNTNNFGFIKNTYGDLVAEYYDIPNGFFAARSGWRTHEALIALDDSYNGDNYSTEWLKPWSGFSLKQVQNERTNYQTNIQKADLITINLGNNNLIGTLNYTVGKVFKLSTAGTPCEKAALEAIEHARTLTPFEGFQYMLDAAELMGKAKILVEEVLKDYPQAVADFKRTWDVLIARIRELNPTADILAIGMYNALGNVIDGFVDGLGTPFKLATDPLIADINSYMRCGSRYADEYVYVDVTGVDLTGSPEGSHLGKVGHEYYAKQIENAINTHFLPCRHTHSQRVHVLPATPISLGWSGDLVCPDCGKRLELGKPTVYCAVRESVDLFGAICKALTPHWLFAK